MTIKFANRVKVNSSTTGTGSITLGSAVESFQTFSEGGILDGNTVRYTIVEVNDWEVGTGVYTHSGTILSRTLEESSTGSLLNLTGEQEVFITTSATDIENLGNRSIDYFYFTATAGQTDFTGNDDSSNQLAFYEDNVLVFMNGIVLEGSGQDYTVTGGNTITLTTGASVSDEINVVAFKSFTVADAVPKSTGGQFDANVDFAAGIDVTGNITVTGTVDGRDVAVDGTKLDGIEAGANDYQHPANHPISVITGLQTALDGKVDDGQVLTDVPSGAVFTDTTYSVGDGGLTQVNFTTADNTKLDGIEAGATADQTKADIDALNVDADTLDGQHGAYYTGYTDTAVANLVDSSPGTLDTLNELAAALGDDPNFATTTATNISTKVSKAGDTMTGDLSFGDNDKAIFGSGSDLQIYHDGANSLIKDSGTGHIKILANDFRLQNVTESQAMIVADQGGAVTLYNNGSPKLATTSTGIDVTGTVTADGLTVDGDMFFNSTSTTPTISVNRSLEFDIDTDANQSAAAYKFYANNKANQLLQVSESGDISFYEDTGTTAKFFWDASAESLGIGTTSFPSGPNKLAIQGNQGASGSDTNVAADELFIDNAGDTGMTLGSSNTGTGYYAFADSDVALRAGIFYDHSTDDMGFRVSSSTRMTIDSSGNVGIGTSSPNELLHVSGTNSTALIESTNGTQATLDLKNTEGHFIIGNDGGSLFVFDQTDTTERLRIDSSGNLLVGTTDTDPSNDTSGSGGIALGAASYISLARANATPLLVNRIGTGTENILLKKDGSTVGSIGYESSGLYIDGESGHAGLSFGGNSVVPRDGGARLDNFVDVGSATYRWKDLYLSGKITNDGTGGIQIDTSGNVGIGMAPGGTLSVRPSGTGSEDSHIGFGANLDAYITTGSNGTVIFREGDGAGGNTERMRIDSSGNLLVGKTSTSFGTAGSGILSTGEGQFVRSGNPPVNVNRLSSDGSLVGFYKDGSTVGSIGSRAGDLCFGTGDTGLRFYDVYSSIIPCDPSNSFIGRDNAIDLGYANNRFKDLYLSGGVYLGGTGSANKLDDYETGTWTPTFNSGTAAAIGQANYTKIGRSVTLCVENLVPSDTTSNSVLRIQSLPFAPAIGAGGSVGSVMASYRDDDTGIACYIPNNASEIRMYKSSFTAGFSAFTHGQMFNNSAASIYFNITYFTA